MQIPSKSPSDEDEWRAPRSDPKLLNEESTSLTPLTEAIRTIKRHRKVFLAWVILWPFLGSMYIINARKEYSATATIILNPSRQISGASSAAGESAPPVLDSGQAESQIQVLKSERILVAVANAIDIWNLPDFSIENPSFLKSITSSVVSVKEKPSDDEAHRERTFLSFTDRVSVRRVGQSYVLDVSFQTFTPSLSARVANAICMQYIKAQIASKAASVQRGSEFLQGRIASINSQLSVASDAVKAGKIPEAEFPDADARVISSAITPLTKSSPKGALIVAIALTFSLASSLSAVLVLNAQNRTLKSVDQIAHFLKVRVLSQLRKKRRSEKLHGLLSGATSRKESTLVIGGSLGVNASNIKADLSLELPGQRLVIGVFSWSRGVGRTTIAQEFASGIAATGSSVILIDCDLRNPALSTMMTKLRRSDDPPDLCVSDSLAATNLQQLTNNVYFVDKSCVGESCNSFVKVKDRIMDVIASSPESTLVLDLPAISAEPEVLAICSIINTAILITEYGVTTTEEASRAISAIVKAGTESVGVILNKMP